jgi:hypothetical protein
MFPEWFPGVDTGCWNIFSKFNASLVHMDLRGHGGAGKLLDKSTLGI